MNFYLTLIKLLQLSGKQFIKSYEDPDVYRRSCELVTTKGYPCEIHNVTTEDGYILEIHRIPSGKHELSPSTTKDGKKKVIYIQHGLLDSSAGWLTNLEHQSFGFVAADAGLDVWIGNVRGNKYGLGHTTLKNNDTAFWNFTFNEMAKFDLPAAVDYVTSLTQQPYVYYVGHSQGTLMGFIQFSENADWSKSKVKQYHALAPVAWVKHNTDPMMSTLLKLLDTPSVAEKLKTSVIGGDHASFDTADAKMANWNNTRKFVYIKHFMSGTSGMNILHWTQLIRSGDVGTFGTNTRSYRFNESKVPTYLYWSKIDVFTHPVDFENIKKCLENNTVEIRSYHSYMHNDFVVGMQVARDVYSVVLDHIKKD